MTAGSGFENTLVFAENADFSGGGALGHPALANGLQTDGQLWIGSTALNAGGTHINVGTLVGGAGITIGYSSPNITITAGGGGSTPVDSFAMQTGTSPVVPTAGGLVTFNGSSVAAGTNPVRTNGTAATVMQLEVQTSVALAAADATRIGLSNFNSAQFSVAATGFVSLVGGAGATPAAMSFDVEQNTAPGTDPVLPSATGVVTINGSVVAAHSVPLETRSRALNAFNIEVQYAAAVAGTDGTKSGVSHYNNAQFSTDAVGFVSLVGGAGATPAAMSFDVQANTAPGTDPVLPSAAGIVIVNGAAVAAHSVPIETRSRAVNTYNVEVQYAAAAAGSTATSSGIAHFDSTDFAVDAVGFVTLGGTGAVQTFEADSGSATPVSGNIRILGGPGVTTSAAGDIVTINSVVFTDTAATTMLVDNGYFATAAGTYNLPATAVQGELIHIVCDTAGAVVVDAPALNFIRIGSSISASGGTATSTAIGDSLTLRYRLSTLTWYATSVVGNFILT